MFNDKYCFCLINIYCNGNENRTKRNSRDATNPKPWDLLSHGLDLNLDLDLVWTLVWICYQEFGFGFGFDIKDLDLVWIWLCWNHKFRRRKTDVFITKSKSICKICTNPKSKPNPNLIQIVDTKSKVEPKSRLQIQTRAQI